jgi:hypothetical protein
MRIWVMMTDVRRALAIVVGLLAGCGGAPPVHYVHVEVFAHGRVVLIPAGLGIDGRRDGAYVRGHRRGVLFTEEPTGLVGVRRPGLTLADLYAAWGRRLGRPMVEVDGRPWRGTAADVPLRPHAQIVVQEGYAPIVPHPTYRFPPGH